VEQQAVTRQGTIAFAFGFLMLSTLDKLLQFGRKRRIPRCGTDRAIEQLAASAR